MSRGSARGRLRHLRVNLRNLRIAGPCRSFARASLGRANFPRRVIQRSKIREHARVKGDGRITDGPANGESLHRATPAKRDVGPAKIPRAQADLDANMIQSQPLALVDHQCPSESYRPSCETPDDLQLKLDRPAPQTSRYHIDASCTIFHVPACRCRTNRVRPVAGSLSW